MKTFPVMDRNAFFYQDKKLNFLPRMGAVFLGLQVKSNAYGEGPNRALVGFRERQGVF
jgi:hypothetical protein